MPKRYGKAKFPAQLPPFQCTPEMKEGVIEVAQKENISLSEVQRRAMSLFLSSIYSKTIDDYSKSIKTEVQPC